MVPFAPGQHLPMRIVVTDEQILVRTYSVSSAPSDGHIRISVKLQGNASRHLYENVREGSLLEVRPPLGSFTLADERARPVVLIGAGVGITPMISMARELVAQNQQHLHRSIRYQLQTPARHTPDFESRAGTH